MKLKLFLQKHAEMGNIGRVTLRVGCQRWEREYRWWHFPVGVIVVKLTVLVPQWGSYDTKLSYYINIADISRLIHDSPLPALCTALLFGYNILYPIGRANIQFWQYSILYYASALYRITFIRVYK